MQKTQLGKTDLHVSRIGFGSLFVASFLAQYDEANRAVARGSVKG